MTATDFTTLLTNNSANGFSEQDLEIAVKQYPYCQPLRFLLLKKYYEAQHPQKEEQLKIAATYACNRSFLFHLLSDFSSGDAPAESAKDTGIENDTPEAAIIPVEPINADIEPIHENPETSGSEDEIIGEKPFDLTIESVPTDEDQDDISLLEGEIEIDLEGEPEQEVEFEEAIELGLEPEQTKESEQVPEENFEAGPLEIGGLGLDPKTIKAVLDEEEVTSNISIDEEGSLDLSAFLSNEAENSSEIEEPLKKVEKEKKKKKRKKRKKNRQTKIESAATPKADEPISFADWVASLQPKKADIPSPKNPVKAQKTKVKGGKKKPLKHKRNKKSVKASQFSDKSLSDHNDNISETLAMLLALQGNKAKAIEMYEQLILKFPEKSTYFAVKIEKLKS